MTHILCKRIKPTLFKKSASSVIMTELLVGSGNRYRLNHNSRRILYMVSSYCKGAIILGCHNSSSLVLTAAYPAVYRLLFD